MSHLDNIMAIEDDAPAEPSLKHSGGRDRVSSIMDMDYEDDEDTTPSDPPQEKKETHPLNAKKDPESKDEPEEKKPAKKEKEDSEDDNEEEKAKKELLAEKRKYKIKVDGQEIEEEYDDEQIKSALSGAKAIQKRFTELDQQKKQHSQERESFNRDIEYVKKEMGGMKTGFESVINEFKQNQFVKGNPLETVYNLLDKMGLDTAEFEKAVFFHHLPETSKFLDMDDTGRDAYLLANENKWLKKKQNAIKEQELEVGKHRAKLEQENSIKRKAGVSEEQFSELKDELETKHGIKNLTTEMVLEWNKAKPFFTRAEKMAELVPGIDVNKVARILLEYPETTDEWMLENLGYKQVQEKKIEEKLKDKLPPKPKSKSSKDDDDEEDELFSNFRRR